MTVGYCVELLVAACFIDSWIDTLQEQAETHFLSALEWHH